MVIFAPEAPPHSNAINNLIRDRGLALYSVSASYVLLLLLLLWHVAHAFVERLWLLPSPSTRILALNAGTLALLGIVAKPALPGKEFTGEYDLLSDTVLICATIGALMPSVAASRDLKDIWSNVLAVGLIVVTTNFTIFLQLYYIPDNWPSTTIGPDTAMQHKVVMASLFLLLLVLLLQAVALEAMLSEIKTVVLQRLDQMCLEAKPGHKASVIDVERRATWGWEEVEHNTRVKLMMVLTSSPQNVMTRSPCTALVSAVVLLCVILFWYRGQVKDSTSFELQQVLVLFFSEFLGLAIMLSGFICVWRWLRVALYEDRSFLSLVLAAEPSYWCQKVNNLQQKLKAGPLRTQPNLLEEGQWGFQQALWYIAASLMLCFVLPFYRFLVALTRLTYILSALLVQKLIWLPIRAFSNMNALSRKHFQESSRAVDANAEPATNSDYDLGVVSLEGEDARTVGRQFAGAANRIIRRQSKAAKNKPDLKALVSQLRSFECSTFAAGKSKAILDGLHEDGAPYMENLHVEHGYQFGWSLTAVSLVALLAKIEITVLGNSTMSEAAVNAYWQAMEMMQLVDEQFVPCIVCTKETYASACAFAWSKVQKKKRRWTEKRKRAKKEVQLDAINQLLHNISGLAKRHIEEFNDVKKSTHAAAAWSQQAIMSYTMHTLCENLLRCWTDIEAVAVVNPGGGEESNARKKVERMVDHIHALIVEVFACCLSNLPTAVDLSTTDAVQQWKMSEIEKGLVVIAQGKHMWEELQWPTLCSTRVNGLGQLRQWMY